MLRLFGGRKYAAILVAVFVVSIPVHVLADETLVSVSGKSVQAGTSREITLAVIGQAKDWPDSLEAVFVMDSIEYDTTLKRSERASPKTEGVSVAYYDLNVPELLPAGIARFYITGVAEAELLLSVEEPVIVAADTEGQTQKTSAVATVVDKKDREVLGALGGLSTYKPIYFLGGFGPTDAKFQISLKYQLFNEKGRWAQKNPWMTGFHLGYTQVSFWDLSAKSKPFEDTNFMPEVFYSADDVKLPFLPENSGLDLQVGFQHESNGRDEFNSRSLNVLYARASYEHMLDKDWFVRLTGDVWDYVGSLSDNPDIKDFRGHSSFQLVTGTDDGLQLSAYRRGRIGSKKSSYLFDLTVPLRWRNFTKNLNFSLHGQLFTGYGENLLTYDQKETRFRIGIGIHR